MSHKVIKIFWKDVYNYMFGGYQGRKYYFVGEKGRVSIGEAGIVSSSTDAIEYGSIEIPADVSSKIEDSQSIWLEDELYSARDIVRGMSERPRKGIFKRLTVRRPHERDQRKNSPAHT